MVRGAGLKVEGIVFDLDATLVNLGGFVEWRKAHKEIVDNYLEMDCDDDLVRACSAKGLFSMIDEMYVNLVENDGSQEALHVQSTAYSILSSYEEKGATSCTIMEGCTDTLDWLKQQGIPCGVCTSNSPKSALQALEIQDLTGYFKSVVGRTIDLPMKPHPDQVLHCFNELNVDPVNGLMVGDSHKDVIAGKKAGAYTVGIPAYFTKVDLMKEADVDTILENISQLPSLISSLLKTP